MPQLHLYVPEAVAAEIGRRAHERGMSVSRYLAEIVRRDVGRVWPAGFFEEVVGGWRGAPLDRAPQERFEGRDEF